MSVRIVGFPDLDTFTAYAVWKLRQDVFVVEQQCPYPDLDGLDLHPDTRHVLLLSDETADAPHRLLGYLRVLEEDAESRIGRVVLASDARGQGRADELMRAALDDIGERSIVLAAQAPLAGWYASFGFEVTGPEFLDDGIPHLPMRRSSGHSL